MFYSDKPINSNIEDRLNRKGFAKILANTLVNLESKDTFTVGLFGKWGCGKTSLINMTLAEINNIQRGKADDEKMVVIHFEPWNFSDTNQLLNQFFIRLANEFSKKGDETINKIGEALEEYSEAFTLLEEISSVGNFLPTVGKWGLLFLRKKLRRGIDKRDVMRQKEQVIDLLSKQEKRILVILDDIDRLNKEQIRYIFQLITSVAKFPNMTYLVVFDKEVVLEALQDVQSGNGQEYLEKVIQMPIEIPDIQRADLRNVLFERLEAIAESFSGIGYNREHWQEIFETCVDPFVTHLRDVNRLCNSLQFKLTGIYSEIDFADMIAISVLEIHHPLIYKWIKNNKSILTGENDYSAFSSNKSQQDWLEYYRNIIREIVLLEKNGDSVKGTDLVMKFLGDLFPHFGNRIGNTYRLKDMGKFNRNNQIAHPDKFERYFKLDIDGIPYRTVDIHNIIYRFDKDRIIDFLCKQEQDGNSYELLEDIKSRISEIPEERVKILIRAIFETIENFDKTVQKTWFSMSTRTYAEHMMLDLLEQITTNQREKFIIELISDAEMSVLQSIANVINMLELGYGRLAAEGKERNYKKVIMLDELLQVEKSFIARVKELLRTNNLFESSHSRKIYHLLECLDSEYLNIYRQEALKQNENVLRFMDYFVIEWIGTGKSYEVQDGYKEYLSDARVLEAIELCRQKGSFFELSNEIQNKCAAFYLVKSEGKKCNNEVKQEDTEKVLSSWRS